MLSRQNLPMPLLRVVLQFLSLAVSVMEILVISQDEASARRTKRARAHYHERAPLYCCKGRAYRWEFPKSDAKTSDIGNLAFLTPISA